MKRTDFDALAYQPLEAAMMKKVSGGNAFSGSTQLHTVTISPSGGGDDGVDDLDSGETQD